MIPNCRFSHSSITATLSSLLIATLLLPSYRARAEITTTESAGVLTISSDAADDMTIACTYGYLQINDYADENITCDAIATLQITGGTGPNRIDASGILTEDFPNLTTITLAGGGGDDQITGTTQIDTLAGDAGNDTLAGGKGNDQMSGGAGADELIWRNGDNSDTMEGGEGNDTVHVIGAPDKGDAFVVAPNGERVAFSRTNLIPFTLDIASSETVQVYRGDPSDTVQISRLVATQVVVDGVTPSQPKITTQPTPMVILGSGEISNTVAAYRLLLGGENNGGAPGWHQTGRREINWDGVPDEQAAPNGYDPDFFNAPTAPRARGAVLSTPGELLMVSADSDNPDNAPPRFGNLNPNYPDIFQTFSAERLFSPVGSNIADITFYLAGSDTPAVSRGFGAVYTDIDTTHTAFEYFDINGNSLGKYGAPIANEGLSFLGVIFPQPIVHRVRIHYGTSALGPDDGDQGADGQGVDVAVMDDFIYGEPQPVPVVQEQSAPVARFQTVEAGRLASLTIDLSGLSETDTDTEYAVWLIDDEGGYTLAGTVTAGQQFQYTHPSGANLVGITGGVALSVATEEEGDEPPSEFAYMGEIPAAIRADVRSLVVAALDTPDNMPYDPGLKEQSTLAWEHGQLAQNAALAGDLSGARMHSEHVWNILHGEASDLYGDINEDGKTQNPGDGYGVWPYAFQVAAVAKDIAATPALDAARQAAALGVVQCSENISAIWGPAADEQVLAILAAGSAAEAKPAVQALVMALDHMRNGVDADADGTIAASKGECGAEQAYQLSHQLFDLPLLPNQ